MTRNLILTAALISLAVYAQAQQVNKSGAKQGSDVAAKQKEMNEWNAQLSQLKRTNLAEYEAMRTTMTIVSEMGLARLGYDPGPFDGTLDVRTVAALKKYEGARGLRVTGEPTEFVTFTQMKADVDAIDAQPAYLPLFVFSGDSWDRGWVSVSGTWTIVNDTSAYPDQTTNLNCDRASLGCVDATASVSQSDGGGPLLSLDTTHHDIERWDEHEIVTKPSESGFGCTRTVIRINRLQKSVSLVRSTISREGLCGNVSLGDLIAKLVDGAEIWRKRWSEWREKANTLLNFSPEARAALSKLK